MRVTTYLLIVALWPLPVGAIASDEKAPATEIDRRLAHAEELFEQGHTAESKEICESLLRTLEDGPSSHLGHTLNVLSKISASEGDYDHAIADAQRSADAYRQAGDTGGEAHALNNKGIGEIQTGAYPAAQQDLERALQLSQSGNDLENQVQVLNNLGSAYFFRGGYSEATRSYEAAMAIVNGNASAKWSDYWLQITRFNQATLLQRLGHYDRALHSYREVEKSSKTLTDSDRAHLYANLGTLYRRLGDPYKALDTYRVAQRLYSKQHDADGEIAVLKNIGIAYALDLDDLGQAAAIFRSALSLAEKTHNQREQMQGHLYLGETLLRERLLTLARQEFEHSQTLAGHLATPEEEWKSLYGLGRIEKLSGNDERAERDYREAIALIEKTRIQLQMPALRAEFFADKREAYDALLSILFTNNDVSEAFLFLEKSRARNFQDRLQAHGNAATSGITLHEAKALLPAETALLEFWTAGNQIGLIWCTHDREGIQLQQLSADQQARVQSVLRDIPSSLNPGSNEGNLPLDVLLPGTRFLPSDVRHLLIVPDAWISYVPFDLLHAGEGTKEMLIESYDISYLPSAALLHRTSSERRMRWPWNLELVAFGHPQANPDPPENQTQNTDRSGAQDLPYSEKEIKDISQLAHGRSKLFLQSADLKRTFLDGTANSGVVLHVSTHAFADGDSPENSRLLFSVDSPGSAASYVFLRELYGMDLSQVRLATISACDTERGKIIRGEGVQAFSRALLSTGAGSSLTALWRVDDQPTAEFMKQFYYFAMKENRPKAEALRLAKVKFLRSTSGLESPSIWAAFVLNGDGLAPLPRTLSWTELALGAAALLLIVLAFVLWSRRRRDRQQSPRGVIAQ
jgi:CHAT domain-containing protein